MVHGICYGIEYQVLLSKPLDLYDHILPICIGLRTMLKFDPSDPCKIVILDSKTLAKRFDSNPVAQQFVSDPDVQHYSELIKHELVPNKILGSEEIEQINKNHSILISQANEPEFWSSSAESVKKRSDIQKTIEIMVTQEIISDSSRYTRAIELESQMCQIELTDVEKDLINQVISNPIITPILKYSGLNLIKHNY